MVSNDRQILQTSVHNEIEKLERRVTQLVEWSKEETTNTTKLSKDLGALAVKSEHSDIGLKQTKNFIAKIQSEVTDKVTQLEKNLTQTRQKSNKTTLATNEALEKQQQCCQRLEKKLKDMSDEMVAQKEVEALTIPDE